ncbi:response regulator [Camelimonas sp. ID_303_24]
MRVLIIEDEALLALEYELLLEELGCDPVGVAGDSVSALAMARELAPDLAVVDVNLQDGMTGADLGVAIAADPGVPVLFVTSEANHVDLGAERVLGALPKPFTSAGFAAAIDWARSHIIGATPAPRPVGLLTRL